MMIGYMNGLALTILVGLPKLFGFKDATGLIGEFTAFVKGLAEGGGVASQRSKRPGRPRLPAGS
jgi:hypothetical protein